MSDTNTPNEFTPDHLEYDDNDVPPSRVVEGDAAFAAKAPLLSEDDGVELSESKKKDLKSKPNDAVSRRSFFKVFF